MSATHRYLTARHHTLLDDLARLERTRDDLAKMRKVLAELPAMIASAEEYEGVLSRRVELERDLLREESSRTGWEPPAPAQQPAPAAPSSPSVPPALIGEQLERERSGAYPITQPVTPPEGVPAVRWALPVEGSGGVHCMHCLGELHRVNGTWLHTRTQHEECDPTTDEAADAAHSEPDGSTDL